MNLDKNQVATTANMSYCIQPEKHDKEMTMTQKIAIHKGKEQCPSALWWRPFFDWQKQMNDTLQGISPSFVPPAFWTAETNVFSRVQKNVNEMFGQLFNNRQMFTPWLTGGQAEPYVDILENGESFFVKADLPGVESDDLDVSVSGNALIIKGENCKENFVENAHYIRRECCSGSFSRTIALPEDADLDNAEATFSKNVLTVEIPKKADASEKPQKMPIAANEQKHNKAA
ncbi:MAG: Hsp20/alpha crystallin family protein [Micavibrio sp.]